MTNLLIPFVPIGMTVIAVALTLGVYQQYLQQERRDVYILMVVRELALVNVVGINILVGTLIMLSLGGLSGSSLTHSLLCGLVSTMTLSSITFARPTRAT